MHTALALIAVNSEVHCWQIRPPCALKRTPFLPSLHKMGHDRFKPTPIPRERRQRHCTRFALTDATGQPIEIMIRDMSPRGLSAAALGVPPAPETVVRACLEDGQEVWGLVRWNEGNLFGVEFDTRRTGPAPVKPQS